MLEKAPPPLREKKLTPSANEAIAAHQAFLKRFDKDGAPPEWQECQ